MTQPRQDLISAVKEHHVRKDFAYDAKVIERNVNKLKDYIINDYQRKGYNSEFNVTVSKGRKYWKVITDNSVHCFVDKLLGHVYKPASYNKPADIIRYNLLTDPQTCFDKCDWSGGYLYLR
jgi:hypothetical protein